MTGSTRRVSRWVLRVLLPAERRHEVQCDLDERFDARARREGPAAAERWYARQAVLLAFWGLREWVSDQLEAFAARRWSMGRGAGADLRIAARSLAAHPGFALTAILTLGLGVGGNTAVFSVVDGVLLRPLPYSESHELVAIHETRLGQTWWSASPLNVLAWRERSQALEDVAWAQTRRVSLITDASEPEPLRLLAVSPNLFDLLGVEAHAGRLFDDADAREGAEPVVVLTHDTWATRYGSDPAVLRRRIDLDGVLHGVVGVLPAGVEPGFFDAHAALVPRFFTETELQNRGRILQAIGRLAPAISLETARGEMDRLAAELDAETPAGQARGWGVRLVPLKEQLTGGARMPLLVLLGAVGFVLLVACANVSQLVLARGNAKRGELAVRTALGASRGSLVRHLLAESLLVGLLGGAVGLVLAIWGTDLLLTIDRSVLPRLGEVEPDGRMLAFTTAITLFSAVLFGLAPALRVTRLDLRSAFQSGASRGAIGMAESRIRGTLVAAEVGLVFVLLVGAGVMIRSLGALGAVDPGFATEGRLAVRLILPRTRYPDAASMARFAADLTSRARAIPGVVAAGSVTTLPLSGRPGYTSFQVVRSLPPPEPGAEPIGGMEIVSPGYFEAMGIPLLAGRDFASPDMTGDPPRAIVDRALADRSWPDGGDPLADAIRMAPPGAGGVADWRQIVGVVGAVRYGLDSEPRPRLYVPEGQVPFSLGPRTLVVRLAPGAIDTVVPALREALLAVDPLLPIERVESLEDVSHGSIARSRFQATLLSMLAAVAVVLGAVGVYGVVSYTVGLRRGEVGLRMALGASRRRVLGGVMQEALAPVSAGLALGLVASALLSRTLASLTFGIEALDPVSLGVAPALLLVVASAAALVPGWRASRIDPARALREN